MSIIGYDKSKTFEKHFYKDIFEFSINVEDKSIFEDIQEFISFEVGSKPNVVYDTIRIVFKDKTKLDSNDRILAEKGHRITIHGGTPNQQVYGKKVVTQEKTIYRIPLNDEYILQNKEQDFYVLYGGADCRTAMNMIKPIIELFPNNNTKCPLHYAEGVCFMLLIVC